MKPFLNRLILSGLLITACGGLSVPGRAKITTTPPLPLLTTSTPTPPIGTWETVIEGLVYDRSGGPGQPIVGAVISYNVRHSYFPELQAGRPNQSTTNQLGKFVLPVVVHDTDSIRLVVEAAGYTRYEKKLVGLDLLGGKHFDIELTPDQP